LRRIVKEEEEVVSDFFNYQPQLKRSASQAAQSRQILRNNEVASSSTITLCS